MVRFGQKTAPVCQGESGHSGAKITRLGRPGLFPFREAERIFIQYTKFETKYGPKFTQETKNWPQWVIYSQSYL
jgi:hypothetical protein